MDVGLRIDPTDIAHRRKDGSRERRKTRFMFGAVQRGSVMYFSFTGRPESCDRSIYHIFKKVVCMVLLSYQMLNDAALQKNACSLSW